MSFVGPRCRETAGFLFSHPCDKPASRKCDVSGVAICDEHAHEVSWRALVKAELATEGALHPNKKAVISTSVAKELDRRAQAAAAEREGVHHSYFYGDPFFYRSCYYDPWDFTDGDAAAFGHSHGQTGDEFEHDMQGS